MRRSDFVKRRAGGGEGAAAAAGWRHCGELLLLVAGESSDLATTDGNRGLGGGSRCEAVDA